MKRACDIMTTPVIQVNPDTSVAAAARLLVEHRVSGLPVVAADGALVGILTEGDLLRRSELGTVQGQSRWRELLVSPGKLAREYVLAHARRVSEIMTTRVVAVAAETPLDQVVALMERHRVKRLPVIDSGRMVGIVSRANLVAALVDALTLAAVADKFTAEHFQDGGDAALRERIREALRAQYWAPRGSIDVIARDGAVELSGVIFDERERAALRLAVEGVAGVKSVTDRLTWVEPVTGAVVLPTAEQ